MLSVDAKVTAAYHQDGVAVLRNMLDEHWIRRMRRAIDRILGDPGPAAVEYTPANKPGRYYGDFFIWLRDHEFEAFVKESPLPALAAQILKSDTATFFYDQLLVKEPQTQEPTPWHHDLPYWPIRGTQIMSFWVPFDPVDLANGAVQYVRGSHLWGKQFAPAAFGKKTGFAEIYEKMGLEQVPDIDGEPDRYELVHFDLEPGDLLIHHPLVVHGAPGNQSTSTRRRGLAMRYVGDDCVYDDRPGTFIENPKVKALLPKFTLKDGDPLSGPAFPKVWPFSA